MYYDCTRGTVDLKKSESRVKELLERNVEKGKKISQLENVNTRLKVLKDQAQEIEEKTKHHRRIHDEVSTKKSDTKINWKKDEKKKCKFENSGTCRRKNSCGDYHPKTTCQSYSKLGSCPLESRCVRTLVSLQVHPGRHLSSVNLARQSSSYANCTLPASVHDSF